jgi:hypothetical protein
MKAPSIFISYSHKDEEWKDRVVTHLRVLEMEGMLDVWDDRRIEAGDDWFPEIENAINSASIAILLVSANFLTSKFIREEEVSRLLERRTKDGVRVIPLIVKPCAWTQVKWLSSIQGRPKDGRPLSAGNENQIDTDLAALAEEIAKIIHRVGAIHESPLRMALPPDKISLAKLPSTSPDLFGREKELALLDAAWTSPQSDSHLTGDCHFPQKINIVTLVAWGGVGKTALVNKWLLGLGESYGGAERAYGWSFYSQGAAEGRQVSADQFIAAALAWFGDSDPNAGSPWDKGERLAELIKAQRTLLILDGLEPLQSPPPVETGKIKDPALTSLLRELARQNPGLVAISTRLSVDDLKDCVIPASAGRVASAGGVPRPSEREGSVLEIDLESLSDQAGADYLTHLGVDGTDKEREQASHDFGGHALAITLLGRYLKVVHGGDIRKRGEIPHVMDERKQGAHARRVMASYEAFLKDKPELDILRLLGLFDRPAEKGALDALRKEPAIAGLTDKLQNLSDVDWQYAVEELRNLHLIARSQPTRDYSTIKTIETNDELDCHPLLREHFGEQLKTNNPAAWREANSRLYEYYKASAKEYPDTLPEMTPLFAAVLHGCQAGKYQETLDEVYYKRILRTQEFYSSRKLGAMGSNLSALSNLFDPPWRKPVDGLTENLKGFALNEAGFYLRALGRLAEAAQPMQASLDVYISQQSWEAAATTASNLSELYLTIGDVGQALAYAEQSVGFADKSGDEFMRQASRPRLANALHQQGNIVKAEAVFREAEEIQKKRQPEFPLLYSDIGFQYCDLLSSQGNYAEVERRASQTLKWAKQGGLGLLTIALDNLSLGRARMMVGATRESPLQNDALQYLNRAVDGLRQAGYQEFIVRGLLARAEYYRVTGALDKAQKDLDEAFSIATRGGMGLHLADCHLGYARLESQRSKVEGSTADDGRRTMDEAREHVRIAKEMIEKMGYHRRDKEVEELEEQLK